MWRPGKGGGTVDWNRVGVNAAVVIAVGVVVARMWTAPAKPGEQHLKRNIRLRSGPVPRVRRIEDRLESRIDRLQASVDALHSDLIHVALGGGFYRDLSES